MSVFLESALHSSDFGLAHYGLVCAIGQESIHQPKNILHARIHYIVTHEHCSYCVYNEEMLFSIAVLSRACHTNLPPSPLL
jgi:hypothetical protein